MFNVARITTLAHGDRPVRRGGGRTEERLKGGGMKRFALGVTGALLTLGMTAACMPPESTSGTDSGTEDGPIKLGAAVSETGAYSVEGKSTKEGYELWAKTVNEEGGIDV